MLVTEQVIRDYFEMMAEYGVELEKLLKQSREDCKSLIKAKWGMVEADCKKSGNDAVQAYHKNMELIDNKKPINKANAKHAVMKCIANFKDTLDKAEYEIVGCIENYAETALLKCTQSKNTCEETLSKIMGEKKVGPKIHIGNKDYDFTELLIHAEASLLEENNGLMFDNFKNVKVVDAAIGAFRAANVF